MSRGKKFVVNVIWNWLGVLVSLFIGFFISPYLIRRLGPDAYGVWSLTFALVDYWWFFDLGFRSATTKYVAHYHTRGEPDKVQEVINTGMVYAAGIVGIVLLLVAALLPLASHVFKIPAQYLGSFRELVWLVTINWASAAVVNLLTGSIEAIQRFDVSNRITITAATVRAIATVTVLYLGNGLVAVGFVYLFSQMVGYIIAWFCFRNLFPDLRISFRYARRETLGMMWKFGRNTFGSMVGLQMQTASAPVLIAHFLPTAFVGFYNLPNKLLSYTIELVGRIGAVTNSNTAALAARGEYDVIGRLAIYINRYCLVIFMPMAVWFLTHGDRFFVRWVGPAVAAQSAPVLPILLLGNVIAIVGQNSSIFLLQGLGKHKPYAIGMITEGVLGIALMLWTIPHYGIVGAAWVISILMIFDRGLFVPFVVSRIIGLRLATYMHHVYTWPLVAAIPAVVFGWWLRLSILPGNNWLQIFAAGALIGIVYYAVAVMLSVEREHRSMVLDWVGQRFRRAETKAA